MKKILLALTFVIASNIYTMDEIDRALNGVINNANIKLFNKLSNMSPQDATKWILQQQKEKGFDTNNRGIAFTLKTIEFIDSIASSSKRNYPDPQIEKSTLKGIINTLEPDKFNTEVPSRIRNELNPLLLDALLEKIKQSVTPAKADPTKTKQATKTKKPKQATGFAGFKSGFLLKE